MPMRWGGWRLVNSARSTGSSPLVSTPTSSWQLLRVGGGGYVTGIDVNADGTIVVRTDVYGAYLGSTTLGTQWQQLITSDRIPSGIYSPSGNGNAPFALFPNAGGHGVYEIRTAPSNSSVIYIAFAHDEGAGNGTMIVSSNKGTIFVQSNLTAQSWPANDQAAPVTRLFGAKMCIDPHNPDVCYVGTYGGQVFVTTNGTNSGGATFTAIATSTIPANSAGTANGGMQFDPNSGTTGGKTNKIFIPVYGSGVYISTNAGSAFALSTGSPTTVHHGKVASDGTYFALDNSGNFWNLIGTTWTNISPAGGFSPISCFAIDPNNAGHIVGVTSGHVYITTNGNTASPTWQIPNGDPAEWAITATDVPWLHNIYTAPGSGHSGTGLDQGDVHFDPSVANRLWYSFGFGVAYSTNIGAPGSPPTTQQWVSQSAGIEEMVAQWIAWPPGGAGFPIVSNWDLPCFVIQNPNQSPSHLSPKDNTNESRGAVTYGSQADFAKNNNNFVVCVADTGTSGAGQPWSATDGGVSNTWTAATAPATSGSGNIAVATSTLWAYLDRVGSLYVTTNGGTSWSIPTGPPSGIWSIGFAGRLANCLCTDRVNGTTFYAYARVGLTNNGVWRSNDGVGGTWTLVHSGSLYSGGDGGAQLKAVPGNAGHLFLAFGPEGGAPNQPTPGNGTTNFGPLARSTDGGVTWTNVSNVLEVWCFGFSAPMPGGGGYPAVGIVGWVNHQWGIWRSDDNCVTWNLIDPNHPFPLNWLDGAICMEGDPNNWNRWIVGFQGSSYKYYGPGTF